MSHRSFAHIKDCYRLLYRHVYLELACCFADDVLCTNMNFPQQNYFLLDLSNCVPLRNDVCVILFSYVLELCTRTVYGNNKLARTLYKNNPCTRITLTMKISSNYFCKYILYDNMTQVTPFTGLGKAVSRNISTTVTYIITQ
jgi:hypothetical protein